MCIGLALFFPFGIAGGGDWLGLVLILALSISIKASAAPATASLATAGPGENEASQSPPPAMQGEEQRQPDAHVDKQLQAGAHSIRREMPPRILKHHRLVDHRQLEMRRRVVDGNACVLGPATP